MKNILTAALLALTPVAFAADDLAAEIAHYETHLAAIDTEMRALKEKYPSGESVPAAVENELLELAHQYDLVERRLQHRRWNRASEATRGLASDSQPRRPAAGTAVEHLNGTCAFVADVISKAADLREGGIRWKENGQLDVNDSVPSASDDRTQTFTVNGSGLSLRRITKARTTVRLSFNSEGRLQKLFLEDKGITSRRTQTIDYEWQGDRCAVDRVSMTAPELQGKDGVAYDRGLCRALESKGLLEEKKIAECSDYNDNIGAVMEKAASGFGDKKVFALFTTDPSGKTSLQPWTKKAHLSVNAAIARDCVFHLKDQRPRTAEQPAPGNIDELATPANVRSAE